MADVTVIAVSYNHARFVREALDSIAAQTVPFELIVCDDASTDDSQQVIDRWLAETGAPARRIFHTENCRLSPTLNEALGQVTTRYVGLLAGDDAWLPHKLADQVAALEANPDAAVCYSDAEVIDEAGALAAGSFILTVPPYPRPDLAAYAPAWPAGDVFPWLAYGNFIPGPGALLRAECVREVGGWDETLAYEDWDMWLRLAARWQFVTTARPTGRYRVVTNSQARTVFRDGGAADSACRLTLRSAAMRPDVTYPLLRWARNQAEETWQFGRREAPERLRDVARTSNAPRDWLAATAAAVGVPARVGLKVLGRTRPPVPACPLWTSHD